MSALSTLLAGSPFLGYSYAYPHKTAYRPLAPRVPLRELWRPEKKDALFLYLHVPFCTMRCGFCNLFTLAQPDDERVGTYLEALRRQASRVSEALGAGRRFARFAMGGGTPTYLSPPALEALFTLVRETMEADPRSIPTSVETSPDTATTERLSLLREVGVSRISIGVQRFDETRVRALGRPQRRRDVEDALARIRALGFETVNLDLIYGGERESIEAWRQTVREALAYDPEELYLYPLYIRPLTGLGQNGKNGGDARLEAYRVGRDLLLESGYRQLSMRYFRREPAEPVAGPAYSCQSDGMVGLGVGARSYTRRLHYSTEYAVGRSGVRSILDDFNARSSEAFGHADYGCRLDDGERHRRYVIQSLLLCEGLSRSSYRDTFGTDVLDDLPGLVELEDRKLAVLDAETIRLTELGIERSDVIGPWLGSDAVRSRMESYSWR